jgi:hypothetical protein
MSSILEALTKAEREVKKRSHNTKAAGGIEPRKNVWETVTIRPVEMALTAFDAQGQWGSGFKPRRIAVAILLLLLLFVGILAWDVWLRPVAVTAQPPSHKVFHHHDVMPAPPLNGPITLRGEIAYGLSIEMHLVREGSMLSGSYSYERIGKDIEVQGTIEETGNVVLEEFAKGRKTGLFAGRLVSARRIEGKWSKPGSTTTRDFFLVSSDPLQNMPVAHDQKRMDNSKQDMP